MNLRSAADCIDDPREWEVEEEDDLNRVIATGELREIDRERLSNGN